MTTVVIRVVRRPSSGLCFGENLPMIGERLDDKQMKTIARCRNLVEASTGTPAERLVDRTV